MSFRVTVFGFVLALGSCVQPAPPPASGPPAFTVGNPYQSRGEWLYPHDFTAYDRTGLSEVVTNAAPITADNESYDPDALAAASPVLQLPAIVTITDLVDGRSVDVRVNDRGPDNPGRIIAVTPKVASVLGLPEDGVVEVEVALNVQKTAALDATLGQGPKLTAAPEAGIQTQSLAAPGQSAADAAPGQSAAAGPSQDLPVQGGSASVADPGQLSGAITMVAPAPGPLYVQIPGFGRARDANDTMNALAGLPAFVVPVFGGDRTLYAVKLGPYHSVADADAALQQVLQRGVVDPEIIVR
jgi:rare lipoprotein A